MKTSPSLYFKHTGSSLQISLTSSPFNIGRRAPTIYEDEPFTVLQTDGLLPTKPILTNSPFDAEGRAPTFTMRQTGSSLQFSLTSSPLNIGERAPIDHTNEPFIVLRTDRLLPTILIDELSRHFPFDMYSRALINYIHWQVLTGSLQRRIPHSNRTRG